MKSKSFYGGLSWLIILNLLVKPVWIFVIDRQVQNIVGHEAYGIYFALLNLTLVLSFLADAGLSNMVTRDMADGKRLNTGQLLRLKLLLLLIFFASACFIGWISKIAAWDILLYVITVQALSSLFLFFCEAC